MLRIYDGAPPGSEERSSSRFAITCVTSCSRCTVPTDEQRENFIEGKLVDYRRLARDQLVQEFPELIASYDARRQDAPR